MIQYADKHDEVGKCLHGQHGQSVQSEYSNHMYMPSVQRIKDTISN